jgi:hypothetical protein
LLLHPRRINVSSTTPDQRRKQRKAPSRCHELIAATKRQPFDVVHELFENEHVQLLFLFKISLFGTWLVDTMA